MPKKTTRLQFTADDLADGQVRKAAEKAEKAADKADKAKAKLPTQRKLRWEREGAENELRHGRGSPVKETSNNTNSKKKQQRRQIRGEAKKQAGKKLRFVEVDAKKPSTSGRVATHAPASALSGKLHREIHRQNEDDNAGVQATHFAEETMEGTARTADHFAYSRKLHRHQKAERLEAKADKANVNALYQKFRKDNPEAASNPISRWRQKQAIKKQYAAAKAGKSVQGASVQTKGTQKAAESVKAVGEKLMQYAQSHAHIIVLILCAGLLVLLISGSLSSCTAMLGGTGNAVIVTSYTAEDEDILGAEADYKAMEEELRRKIQRLQNSDEYDEIRLNVDEIGHNPRELASLLTVLYEDYTRQEVQQLLRQLFEAQYYFDTAVTTETETETKTVRVGESLGTVTTSGYCSCPICCGIWSGGPTASGVYPTANHTLAVDANNPFVPMGTKVIMNGVEYTVEDTGNFARYGVQFDVYYDNHFAALAHGHKQWECYLADSNGSSSVQVTTTVTKRILTITATNRTLRSIINNLGLSDDEMERFHLLLETQGNKPYLFEDDVYATSTGEYLDYDIPGEALTDEKFRRMITEAEKYLGYPYVWGGSSPSTSFDCSGFVSWVINNCGNGWSVGRRTANGLMDVCDIIRKSEAKPGDLIFFQGTYDTSGASHVGIYVGNGMMIHCGNPISYASIESSYWQSHFYCFGRIKD